MAKITIEDLISYIDNWDEDKISIYGGVDKLLTMIEKKGRLKDIDLRNGNLDDNINHIYWALINSNDPEIRKYGYDSIKEIDVSSDLIKKDDKWFWVLNEVSELSVFFCSDDGHRENSSQENAKSILGGSEWEPFDFWKEINIYRDVVDDLNEENLNHLRNIIIEILSGVSLEIDIMFPETDLLSNLCEEDENCNGDNQKIMVTPEMVNYFIKDEETLNYLFKDHLSDLDSDLRRLYLQSYNDAYASEAYDEVWGELSSYLGDKKGDWVSRPHSSKENVVIYQYYIDVTELSNEIIFKFLESNHESSYRQDFLSYYGGFENVIKQLMREGVLDCLKVRLSDYPDFRLVRKKINENFGEYL